MYTYIESNHVYVWMKKNKCQHLHNLYYISYKIVISVLASNVINWIRKWVDINTLFVKDKNTEWKISATDKSTNTDRFLIRWNCVEWYFMANFVHSLNLSVMKTKQTQLAISTFVTANDNLQPSFLKKQNKNQHTHTSVFRHRSNHLSFYSNLWKMV